MSTSDVVIDRLESQLEWYDKESAHGKRMFKLLKTATLAISVSIPLNAAFATRYPAIVGVITGVMGAGIALLEGLQQLNQYHQNWITFRSTAEALKHEKFLFLSTAGPYAAASNPKAMLAERVESLVSQENAKWTAALEQTPKTQKTSGTP
jgi:Protein of unknown function (DUF4231)